MFLEQLWKVTNPDGLAASLLPGGRRFRGNEWAGTCPYCGTEPGRDPRFSMNLDDGVYKCFKCQEKGNALTLAKRVWGKSWRDEWVKTSPAASTVLEAELGARPAPTGQAAPRSSQAAQPARDRLSAEDAWAAGVRRLEASTAPLEPLAAAWGVTVDWLASQGVVPTRSGKAEAYGFPATDPATGEIVDLKRRVLPPIPADTPKSASWSGGKAGLFGLGALAAKPTAEVFVAEGEKDWAVAAFNLADYAVIGVGMGAGTWMPSWTEALKGRNVVLGYDPDRAGREGAAKVVAYLNGVAASVRVMPPLFKPGPLDAKGNETWPDGCDIFDLISKEGRAGVDRLKGAIASAAAPAPQSFDAGGYLKALIGDLETGEGEVDWNMVGEETFKALVRAGAKFLRVETDVRCVFSGRTYTVGSNVSWDGLLFDLIGRTPEEQPGRIVRAVVKVRAHQRADEAKVGAAWTARLGAAIYMNLNDRAGRQVKITPQRIEIVDNGADGVVTLAYPESRAIEVLSDQDFDEAAASDALDRVVAHFACREEDRQFLRGYILTVPLYSLSEAHPVLRFRGASGHGKSTAAKILTTILYGTKMLSSSTTAALYRQARCRPLVAIDNLEEAEYSRNDELHNFVLVSATGRAREKATRESDSSIVREEVRSLFISTGIEPIGASKPEVVNRTIEIRFDRLFTQEGFYEAGVLQEVAEARTLILNLALRKARLVLGDVESGELRKTLATFPQAKIRLAEFFSLMSLAVYGPGPIRDSLLDTINDMRRDERAAMTDEDEAAALFRAIAKMPEAHTVSGSTQGPHWITVARTRAEDIFLAASSVSKRLGVQMPWKSAGSMSTRLDAEMCARLERHGIWITRSRTSREGRTIQLKIALEAPRDEENEELPF